MLQQVGFFSIYLHCWNRQEVVSIGRFPAFYVVLVLLEYISSVPPHSSYVIVYFIPNGDYSGNFSLTNLNVDLSHKGISSNYFGSTIHIWNDLHLDGYV